MADYCSNKVDFQGENRDQVFSHFSSMGYDCPPYQDIIVDSNAVYFESRWIPPLRDLIQLAESFDVNFKLVYQLPNERAKEKYSYTCLKNEKLPVIGEELRKRIQTAGSLSELEKVEADLHEKADRSQLDSHQRSILTGLIGKRSAEILGIGYSQHTDVASEERTRRR